MPALNELSTLDRMEQAAWQVIRSSAEGIVPEPVVVTAKMHDVLPVVFIETPDASEYFYVSPQEEEEFEEHYDDDLGKVVGVLGIFIHLRATLCVRRLMESLSS